MQLTLVKVQGSLVFTSGQGPPSRGEWRQLSVTDFDPNDRCEDEEYYGEVLSYEMVPDLASGDNIMMFTCQDLGEEAGPEQVTLPRSYFAYVSS